MEAQSLRHTEFSLGHLVSSHQRTSSRIRRLWAAAWVLLNAERFPAKIVLPILGGRLK